MTAAGQLQQQQDGVGWGWWADLFAPRLQQGQAGVGVQQCEYGHCQQL